MVAYTQDELEDRRVAEVRGRMRSYIDPSIGTISFSGADYKAIVFMPMSKTQLKKELELVNNQIQVLHDDISAVGQQFSDLSRKYGDALIAGNTAEQQRLTVLLRALPLQELDYANDGLVVLLERKHRLDELSSQNRDVYTKPIVLGNVQTISYSSHREKFPVRTCGRVFAKSYTRGQRTYAGSLIFTVLDRHPFYELLQTGMKFYSTGVGVAVSDAAWPEMTTMVADQLPPFDITIIGSNEVGDSSSMVLYGVELVNEGQTMSIQDMITENVMQFFARDMDPLRPLSSKRAPLIMGERIYPKTPDDLLKSKNRRDRRLNPFV